MQHILVASDLTARSDQALVRAVRLARQIGLPLRAITVVDADLPAAIRDRRLAEAQAWLARSLRDAGGAAKDATAIPGDVGQAIPADALAVDAALVVLGLHRCRALRDAVRETTMERIAHQLHVPLLLARSDAVGDYARVLVPVSFTPDCAAALAAARRFAPAARLRVIHALHLPFAAPPDNRDGGPAGRALRAEAEMAAADWRASLGQTPQTDDVAIMPGSFGEVLEQELAGLDPDLMALGGHLRGAMTPLGLGATMAALIRRPPCDLLIVRHRPRAM